MSTTTPLPKQFTHLILLCCHAIYLPSSPTHGTSPTDWLLAPFQHLEHPTFIQHLRTALNLLSSTPNSLLVISGSKTRAEIDLSEARSYLSLAEENGFWEIFGTEEKEDLRARIVLEEQALDSFGNLLFGMLAFWRRAGERWMERVTIVSHEFKRGRFMKLHAETLGLGAGSKVGVEFVGVDPGYMIVGEEEYDEARAEEVRRGERERGFTAWEGGQLGGGVVLRGKRAERNHWRVDQVLFEEEGKRGRSGLVTEMVGGEEMLVAGQKFPWV